MGTELAIRQEGGTKSYMKGNWWYSGSGKRKYRERTKCSKLEIPSGLKTAFKHTKWTQAETSGKRVEFWVCSIGLKKSSKLTAKTVTFRQTFSNDKFKKGCYLHIAHGEISWHRCGTSRARTVSRGCEKSRTRQINVSTELVTSDRRWVFFPTQSKDAQTIKKPHWNGDWSRIDEAFNFPCEQSLPNFGRTSNTDQREKKTIS